MACAFDCNQQHAAVITCSCVGSCRSCYRLNTAESTDRQNSLKLVLLLVCCAGCDGLIRNGSHLSGAAGVGVSIHSQRQHLVARASLIPYDIHCMWPQIPEHAWHTTPFQCIDPATVCCADARHASAASHVMRPQRRCGMSPMSLVSAWCHSWRDFQHASVLQDAVWAIAVTWLLAAYSLP